MELIGNYNYGTIIRLSFKTDKKYIREIIKELMEYKEDFDGCEVKSNDKTYDFTLKGWENIKEGDRMKRNRFKLKDVTYGSTE